MLCCGSLCSRLERATHGRFRPNAETVQFFCHGKIFSSLKTGKELGLVEAVNMLPFEIAKRQLGWTPPGGSLHLEGGMSTMRSEELDIQQSFLYFAALLRGLAGLAVQSWPY